MLKVLIVDDELLVRVGIKSTIDWEKYGCTVVAEAGNGEQALEKIEMYHPDIVLTDIRMPKMDGLELLREIRRRKIPAETVIMSCYNEFELVREAMKLGASDYLLKLSFTEEELVEVLERLGKKIEENREQNTGSLFSQADMRKKLFQKLTDFSVTDEQRERLAENLDLCVNFESPAFMIMMTDHVYERVRMGYTYLDEQQKNMLLNLIEEYMRGRKFGEAFWIDSDKEQIAVFLNRGQDLLRTAEIIKNKVKEYLKINLSIYIYPDGTYAESPDFIEYGILELSRVRYLNGPKQICFFRERNDKAVSECLDGRVLKEIRKSSELTELEAVVQNLAGEFQKRHFPVKESQRIFTECVYNVLSGIRRAGGSAKGMEEYRGLDMMKNLQGMETLDDVLCWFADFKQTAKEYIGACVSKGKRSEIEMAMGYIHENYSLPLSLVRVAEAAGFSAAYFSTVFKKENGKSFIEYLTELRMEHAKELLQDETICIYEVGKQVGYPDPNYFSKIFRKSVGISPEKYRKQAAEQRGKHNV